MQRLGCNRLKKRDLFFDFSSIYGMLELTFKVLFFSGDRVSEDRYSNLHKKFRASVRTNVSMSLIFELLKFSHQTALYYILAPSEYGLFGTLFSLIYLANAYFLCGAPCSIPPFLKQFTASKHNFRRLFVRFLASHLAILLLGAMLLYALKDTVSFLKVLNNSKTPLIILMLLILFEGFRMMSRMFLHTIFWHRSAMTIELIAMSGYLGAIWVPYIMYGNTPTITALFGYYLASALGASLCFAWQMAKFYSDLPNTPCDISSDIWPRIRAMRGANYLPEILDRGLLTSNHLVPLFAAHLGLARAGLFKFASYVADGLKSIINVTINFSGNALLAHLKSGSLKDKQQGFALVSKKLNHILIIAGALLLIQFVMPTGKLEIPGDIFQAMLMFFVLSFLGHLSNVYHKFYLVEEKLSIFLAMRLIELLFVAGALEISSYIGAFATLSVLIGIRLMSFAIVSTDAYKRWKIKPSL